MDSKTVVIVGRMNVGKSTLFNCLTDSDDAITSPRPGTTVDGKYGEARYEGRVFNLVDTGGVNLRSVKNSIIALNPRRTKIEVLSKFQGTLEKAVIQQTKAAIAEADLLLMLVDGEEGMHPDDVSLAWVLKNINKPKILACNKADKLRDIDQFKAFRKLGLEELVPISAISGKGKEGLLELITDTLHIEAVSETSAPEPTSDDKPFRIVMIGRSGVGKSSLFNKILGDELAVVSEVYQTTIDANNAQLTHKGKSVVLTDAPGLLEREDMMTDIDQTIHQRTIKIIENADAVLFVTDVLKSLCGTERYLAHLVNKIRVPTVIVANKWDAFPQREKEMVEQITIHYRDYLPELGSSQIVFASAKTGEGVKTILDLALNPVRQKVEQAVTAPKFLGGLIRSLMRV